MGYEIPADHHDGGPEKDKDVREFQVGAKVYYGAGEGNAGTVVGHSPDNPNHLFVRTDGESDVVAHRIDREDVWRSEDVEQARLAAEDTNEAIAQKLQSLYSHAYTGQDDVRAWEWSKITESTREAWRKVARGMIDLDSDLADLKALTITRLIHEAGETAKAKGWHRPEFEPDNDIPRWLCLIHSEVSEALEAHRRNEGAERFAEELADVFIRIADVAYQMDLPLEQAIKAKLEKNRGRDWKHGGKRY